MIENEDKCMKFPILDKQINLFSGILSSIILVEIK